MRFRDRPCLRASPAFELAWRTCVRPDAASRTDWSFALRGGGRAARKLARDLVIRIRKRAMNFCDSWGTRVEGSARWVLGGAEPPRCFSVLGSFPQSPRDDTKTGTHGLDGAANCGRYSARLSVFPRWLGGKVLRPDPVQRKQLRFFWRSPLTGWWTCRSSLRRQGRHGPLRGPRDVYSISFFFLCRAHYAVFALRFCVCLCASSVVSSKTTRAVRCGGFRCRSRRCRLKTALEARLQYDGSAPRSGFFLFVS